MELLEIPEKKNKPKAIEVKGQIFCVTTTELAPIDLSEEIATATIQVEAKEHDKG